MTGVGVVEAWIIVSWVEEVNRGLMDGRDTGASAK